MEKHSDTPANYPTLDIKELLQAILELKTPKEAANFFRDLLTMAEIKEFAHRWQIVKMLNQGKSYDEIAGKLKVSSTTVTRVAYWLNHGMGGYREVVRRLYQTRFKNSLPKKHFRLRGKYTFLKDPNSMI